MKNKEIRKITKEKMKGKMGKAILSILVYFLITFGINFVLGFIPFLGSIASAIIATPLTFGFMKQIICLENGEQISFVDFFKHGIDNFTKVWGTSLRVTLKLLAPIILLIVSMIMISVGIVSASNEMISMCGTVIMIASMIWLFVLAFRYCMVNYTLAYNPGLTSKEIVNKSRDEAKGHIWRFICVGLYYASTIFVVYILGAVLVGVATVAMQDLMLVFMAIYYIILACVAGYYGMMSMAASNEFYKINILGSSDATLGGMADNDSNMTYTQNYDQNTINYGYDPNSNGQSNDYFNNN